MLRQAGETHGCLGQSILTTNPRNQRAGHLIWKFERSLAQTLSVARIYQMSLTVGVGIEILWQQKPCI